MSVNVDFPRFNGQEELLFSMIEEKTPSFIRDYCDESIPESVIIEQIKKEYQCIVNSGTAGIYYLLTEVFDEEAVDRSEIIAYGTSGGAVIPNLLGLTGVGVEKRIRGIFSSQPKYYPELYYGLGDATLDANPSNIRISCKRFYEVILKIGHLLKESENYRDINPITMFEHEVLSGMGIYLSNYYEIMVSDLETILGYKNRCIPSYDSETMDLFYYGSYNNFDTYDDDFTFKVQIPFINEKMKHMICNIHPKSLDEISKAVSMSLMTEDFYLGNIYFREEILSKAIDNGNSDLFNELRKECIRKQIFPRVHIDSIVETCWRMAYYQVHFIRRKKL